MNDAHLHLVVNHFPIIGTILGLGILIAGIVLKNKSVQNTAYVLFVVAAVFGFFSMSTGEGAEEMVEDFPGIGKAIIHEHEEMAEKLALVLYALAITSLFGLYSNLKNKPKAKLVSYIATVVAIIAVFFAQQTGTTGGEVRHTEIRTNSAAADSIFVKDISFSNNEIRKDSTAVDSSTEKIATTNEDEKE